MEDLGHLIEQSKELVGFLNHKLACLQCGNLQAGQIPEDQT